MLIYFRVRCILRVGGFIGLSRVFRELLKESFEGIIFLNLFLVEEIVFNVIGILINFFINF